MLLWKRIVKVPRSKPRLRLVQCSALLLMMSCRCVGDNSLFVELGGEKVLKPVVHRLLVRAHREVDTRRSFKDSDMKRIEEKLYEQICALAQGPCTYTGDDMKLVHGGLQISEREFYALVQQLRDELDRAGVSTAAKNELLARLAPFKRDVVTVP
jgi:hemoglobin